MKVNEAGIKEEKEQKGNRVDYGENHENHSVEVYILS